MFRIHIKRKTKKSDNELSRRIGTGKKISKVYVTICKIFINIGSKGLKQELSCEYGYYKKFEGLQIIIKATDFCRAFE